MNFPAHAVKIERERSRIMRIHLRRLYGRAGAVAVLAALLAIVPAGCGNGHGGPKPRPPVSKTFSALGDSYVRASDPQTNYGSNAEIFVDGTPTVRAYLQFQPVGISRKIEHATLRLYSLTPSADGFQVRATTGGWSESGITYANAPPAGALVNPSGSLAPKHWISIDVTSLVRKHPTSVQVVLVALGPTALTLASREDPRHAPRLVVEYRPG